MQLKQIRRHLQKRLKDKKGSMIIEYTIGLLMLVVFVAFCLDMIIIGHKHYYIGEEMANVARTLSVQSGAELTTPVGYPGGSRAYQTSSEIIQRMNKVAEVAGLEKDEWELYIEEIDGNGNVVRSGILTEETNFEANYLNKIAVEFRGVYQWKAMSGAIPGIGKDRVLNIKRIAMAEYVRSYD